MVDRDLVGFVEMGTVRALPKFLLQPAHQGGGEFRLE